MRFTEKQKKAILKRVDEFYKKMNEPAELGLETVLLSMSVCMDLGDDIMKIIEKGK